MVIAKKFIFAKQYDGAPKKENFQLAEEELPELKDGEFMVEALYFSVDPFLRLRKINVGDTMIGTQVAKIIESRSSKFPVGKYVIGGLGWRTHTIWPDNIPMTSFYTPHLVPYGPEDASLSLALGVLGMPGNTAYYGILEVCKPKPGETVVVSGAAGAIGSHAGQIAKFVGCTVIGIAGSDEKNKWLKSIGFDHVINYKTENVAEALAKVAPQRVDCYFDNVGGTISSIVIRQMREGGRIVVCGSVSSYASDDSDLAPSVQNSILFLRLKMEGFLVDDWIDRWNEGVLGNLKWIQEGKLKYKETITEGFENLPNALIGVFKGDNIGKAIVKA